MASALDNQVPPAVELARRWLSRERADNATRDTEIRKLDNAYNAKLYDLGSADSSDSLQLTADMKDQTQHGRGSTARFSEVPVPMVKSITEDWKSVMAVSPNHLCPPLSPGEDQSEREADRREEIVGGIFTDSCMEYRVQESAHYRSLHGAALWYSLPSPEDKRVRIDVRSSYRTYARLLNMSRDLMYMAWDWEELTEFVLWMWPEVERYLGETQGVKRKGGRVQYPDKLVMTEWYDRKHRIVFAADKWVESMPYAEHNWGFVPGQVVPNVVGLGLWGQSDVQHAVHLSQLYSEMLSMMQDGLFQMIYDIPIIFDDMAVSKIDVGPHEALQMSQRARTGSLRGNVKMPEGSLILDILERVARIGSGWPKVQSSEMDSPIISGKAFVAAQGPVAARAAVKHIVQAIALEKVTGHALRLYEHHFPNDEIRFLSVPSGVRTAAVADRGAVGSPLVFVPSRDIAGVYWVVINFPPGGADQYRHTIEQLQLLEAEVISKETVRQSRPGINPKAERMRVERETREKVQLQAEAATMMAEAQFAFQQRLAGQAAGPPGGAPTPGPGGPPMAQAAAPAAGAAPAPGQVPALTREGPAGPAQAQAARQGATGQFPKVTRAQVRAELAGVRPIRGRVFFMGALARLGWTTGLIELGLTDPNDKAAIIDKTSYGREGRIVFHKVGEDSMPSEGLVNVTPG